MNESYAGATLIIAVWAMCIARRARGDEQALENSLVHAGTILAVCLLGGKLFEVFLYPLLNVYRLF